MKAAYHERYSPPAPIEIREIPNPVPKDNEVLIRVKAATFNRTDCANVSAKPWFMRFITGLTKPNKPISGTDFAGVIEKVGKDVEDFKTGDRVFGFDDSGCSSHAELMTFPADAGIATIPVGVSFESAAASIEGAHYAYNILNKVDLKPGEKVMVNGASGAIGSALVQILKHLDANIMATASTKNLELARSLGASKVIDYSQEDFTKIDVRFDYVFDSVGKSSFGKCKPILKANGTYISSELGPGAENVYLPLITKMRKGKKVLFPIPLNIRRSVYLIRDLMTAGKFNPVIDTIYPLAEIEDAYKYVASGQKTGNVVIKIPA